MSKNRTLSSIISNNTSKIKSIFTDSDSIVSSTSNTVVVAAGVEVYSSVNLLPGSASDGDQALVTSTNRLYIYSGSGWYNIAIINNFNPQWVTEPDSEYTLDLTSIDSDLVITVYATDSDDVPLTYSAVVDSDFNVAATITHDSDKDNRWVISRRDSELGAGVTGVVTFKASDGINLVQKLVSFIVPSNSFTIQSAMATGSGIYAITASDGTDSGTTKNVYID